MSNIISDLEEKIKAAMKSGDKNRLKSLRSLMSKVKMLAKNDKNREPTDEDVVNAAIKMVKENNETKSFLVERDRDTSEQDNEIAVVSEFLPKQLSYEELTSEINKIIIANDGRLDSKSGKGVIMKHLNQHFRGQFDNKVAQEIIAKEL